MGGVKEGAGTDTAAAVLQFVFRHALKVVFSQSRREKKGPVSPAGVSQFRGSRFGKLVPNKVCGVQLNKPGLRATLMFRKSRQITAVNPRACTPNVSLTSDAPRHNWNKSSAWFGTA